MAARFLRCAAFFLGLAAAAAEPPPISLYAALPAAVEPQLSPDGNRLAMISPFNGEPALVIRELDSDKSFVTGTGSTLPDWFQWKTANRLLTSLRFSSYNSGGDLLMETRMVFLNADGGNPVPVVIDRRPRPGTLIIGNPGNVTPQFQDRVVSMLPDDPDHLLLAVTPLDDFIHPDVININVANGYATLVQHHMNDVITWLADGRGEVRALVKLGSEHWLDKQTHQTIMVRSDADAGWITVDEGDIGGRRRFSAVGIAGEGAGSLYVMTDGEHGHLVARSYDIAAHRWNETSVGESNCDAEPLFSRQSLAGFSLPCRPLGTFYLDPAWQRDYEALAKALKSDFVTIQGRSDDGMRTLAAVRPTPSAPADFWLLDRRSGHAEAKWLGGDYPHLAKDQVADTSWISYPARDGTAIPALLTLPVGYKESEIPFVVLPHGGPTYHDRREFDWEVQFLASRGYGVLQPQFRGSTGFGNAFQTAGYQQWGGLMQDDVTDGTRWLIARHLADPARIAIVGGSYGGYAALMGAVKEPDLYACAAAFAPVTDLDDLVRRMKRFAFQDVNVPMVKGDGQSLDTVSPAEQASRIKVPVLLVHGRKDFTVPVGQSETMERALKRAGKQVEAIYIDDADHYFARASDRLIWLSALDKLLASTIGAAKS